MAVISKKIRDSAEGEACTLNIVGVCNYDTTTTVLAHFPDESHGMAKKSNDLSSGYACSACHDVIDRRARYGFEPGEREWYMRRAQTRTWTRLVERGLILLL